jgi:hypothetical protein
VAAGPEELNKELELTRLQLRRDVDALVDRVTPKSVAQRSIGRAQQKVHDSLHRQVEAVRPVAQSVRDRANKQVEAVRPVAQSVRDRASGAGSGRRRLLIGGVTGAVIAAGAVAVILRSRTRG